VKDAARYIDNFEAVVAREAAQRGYAGIVCGHIHKAEIKQIDGVLYCNDGDWVESCTALVETLEGRLEIVHWTDRHNVVTRIETAREPAAAA
jgi:UDP-2,3-diacylglucosamine pyrophosphatase LpxH